MCDRLHLNSIKQTPTPLNTLFFSDYNTNLLQRAVRQSFKDKTGVAIDYQNKDDMFAIMRAVFINNAGNHGTNVNEQVKFMNEMVIKTALSQIQSGVSQFMGYMRDIDTMAIPPTPPANTSTYGMKMDKSDKIGV
ncbi:MAG: hypothetical protein CL881_08960 [Dehalococcoidia bacterium]|nr:hypothetical protein [Dehalococcoidia bacterium]|tara:strand:- start:20457 stop:20861 length:405 start_codon:yes stop_codon:yes gene_type:complete